MHSFVVINVIPLSSNSKYSYLVWNSPIIRPIKYVQKARRNYYRSLKMFTNVKYSDDTEISNNSIELNKIRYR